MDIESLKEKFPVIIPGVTPFHNVLKALRDTQGFEKLYDTVCKGYIINIVQIGAGGTGGFVAAELMRFISNLPLVLRKHIYYTLCDGDTFESKNLNRQLCQEEDIGQNKASVIVENYRRECLEENTFAYTEYITSAKQLHNVLNIPRLRTNRFVNTFAGAYESFSQDVPSITEKLVRNPLTNLCNETLSECKNKKLPGMYKSFEVEKPVGSLHDKIKNIEGKFILVPVGNSNEGDNDNFINNLKIVEEKRYLRDIKVNVPCYLSSPLLYKNAHRNIDDPTSYYLPSVIQQPEENANYIIPIIIDTVDTTTVRYLINECLKSFSYLAPSAEIIRAQLVNFIEDCIESSDWKGLEEEEVYKNFKRIFLDEFSKGMSLYRTGWNEFTIAGSPDKHSNARIARLSKIHNFCSYSSDFNGLCKTYANNYNASNRIGPTYLISSGNGKYVGQVCWGRYSSFPISGIAIESKPLTLRDIFGEEDIVGSAYSAYDITEKHFKDARVEFIPVNKAEEAHVELYVNRKLSNDRYLSENSSAFRTGYEAYTDVSPLKEGDLLFNISLQELAYGLTKEHAQILTKELMIGNYYLRKVVNKFKTIKELRDVANPSLFGISKLAGINPMQDLPITESIYGNDYQAYNIDVDSEDNSYGVFNTAYCNNHLNANYLITIPNYNSFYVYVDSHDVDINNVIKFEIKASDGSLLPFTEQYHSFTDWASQFISVPNPYEVFPNLVDISEDRKAEQMSCAERAVLNNQSINANKTAANIVFNYVTQILNGLLGLETEGGEPVRMKYASTYFDTRNNEFKSRVIDVAYLKTYEESFNTPKQVNTLLVAHDIISPSEKYDREHNAISDNNQV